MIWKRNQTLNIWRFKLVSSISTHNFTWWELMLLQGWNEQKGGCHQTNFLHLILCKLKIGICEDACDNLGGASLPNFNQIFKGWEDRLTLKGAWNARMCEFKSMTLFNNVKLWGEGGSWIYVLAFLKRNKTNRRNTFLISPL